MFFWKPRTEQARDRARHASRPYRDAHIGVHRAYLVCYFPTPAVVSCRDGGRTGRQRAGQSTQRHPCRVLPSSCLLLTNQNQSASHSLVRRGQSLGRDSGADTAKKALADLSCDRCLMQLARVASHQTPGAVDEPIGDGFEVTGLLLQVPHPLPCHE